MAEKTGIEWTNATWNPWYGCHKVSQGCKNCYMFREMGFYGRDPNTVTRSKTKFDDPLRWAKSGKLAPGSKIFTCSWSDWFIEEADGWRPEAWDIIKRTPAYTYQILTKRPERILDHLPADWSAGYSNVWLGVSVENQEAADKRIPMLLKVPAAVRFLSCEPLLGPLDISIYLASGFTEPPHDDVVNWVIIGGESGSNARPFNCRWAGDIIRQCTDYGGAPFLKQLGSKPFLDNRTFGEPIWLNLKDKKGGDWSEWPSNLRVREFPQVERV